MAEIARKYWNRDPDGMAELMYVLCHAERWQYVVGEQHADGTSLENSYGIDEAKEHDGAWQFFKTKAVIIPMIYARMTATGKSAQRLSVMHPVKLPAAAMPLLKRKKLPQKTV